MEQSDETSKRRDDENPQPKVPPALVDFEEDSENSRQNFSAEVEKAINQQIANELIASYLYLSMSNYFARPTVALPGSALFFANQSVEERTHAQKLIDYQNARGGRVVLYTLNAPLRQKWSNLLEAYYDALELEKKNNDALLKLHQIASDKSDPDLTNFLEEFYLKEQIIEIERMARFYNQLRRVGTGLGEHIWDNELLQQQNEEQKK